MEINIGHIQSAVFVLVVPDGVFTCRCSAFKNGRIGDLDHDGALIYHSGGIVSGSLTIGVDDIDMVGVALPVDEDHVTREIKTLRHAGAVTRIHPVLCSVIFLDKF